MVPLYCLGQQVKWGARSLFGLDTICACISIMWCWCHYHMMPRASSRALVHFLAQDIWNGMQHEFSGHVTPLSCYQYHMTLALLSCDADSCKSRIWVPCVKAQYVLPSWEAVNTKAIAALSILLYWLSVGLWFLASSLASCCRLSPGGVVLKTCSCPCSLWSTSYLSSAFLALFPAYPLLLCLSTALLLLSSSLLVLYSSHLSA